VIVNRKEVGMKKIGIVGGLGPASTLDYYKGIIDAFTPTYAQYGYPEISIESMDLKSITTLLQAGAWDEVIACIAQRCEVLKKAGADLGAIASNTPHKMFAQIQAGTSLPLVSIVEATCEHAQTYNLKRLCLLGTQLTMASDFYQQAFDRHGIELVVPAPDEQAYIQEKIFTEIEFGIIREQTRDTLLAIVGGIHQSRHLDGVILGCTELPLIIAPEDVGMHYLDTSAIHVAKIVALCRT